LDVVYTLLEVRLQVRHVFDSIVARASGISVVLTEKEGGILLVLGVVASVGKVGVSFGIIIVLRDLHPSALAEMHGEGREIANVTIAVSVIETARSHP
jgi:hypothetical protein